MLQPQGGLKGGRARSDKLAPEGRPEITRSGALSDLEMVKRRIERRDLPLATSRVLLRLKAGGDEDYHYRPGGRVLPTRMVG